MAKNKNRKKYSKVNRCEKCSGEVFVPRFMHGRYAMICTCCGYFKRWANADEELKILNGGFSNGM